MQDPKPQSSETATAAEAARAADGTQPSDKSGSDDVALIQGPTADCQGLRILRKRADRLEIGALRPLEAGKPLLGEIVRLTPRAEQPLLCDVKVEYSPPVSARPTSKGPAQVATERYRENWAAIWKSPKPTPGSSDN